MPEEYYEKKDMERDLGDGVEPYTEEELIELERIATSAPIASSIVRDYLAPIKFEWEF